MKNLPATQEAQIRSLGQEGPLTKRAATHSSILAWRIPWTGKPGRLPFTGSQSQTPTENYHLLFHYGRGRHMADGGDPRGAVTAYAERLHPADSLRKSGAPGPSERHSQGTFHFQQSVGF